MIARATPNQYVLVGLMLVVASVLFRAAPSRHVPHAAAASPATQSEPAHGTTRIATNGGDIHDVTRAAQASGCDLVSLEAITDGATVRYTLAGALPDNVPFIEAFPGGMLPDGTGLVLQCK